MVGRPERDWAKTTVVPFEKNIILFEKTITALDSDLKTKVDIMVYSLFLGNIFWAYLVANLVPNPSVEKFFQRCTEKKWIKENRILPQLIILYRSLGSLKRKEHLNDLVPKYFFVLVFIHEFN